MSVVHEIEDRAARWLIQREEPGWSATDEQALHAWLDESLAHKAAFWRLEQGWSEANRIASLGATAADPASLPGRRFLVARWKPLALAASLLLAIGLGVAAFWPAAQQPTHNAFATSIGRQRTVALADGSRIELNTATAMRASLGQDRREVWLDRGEAYFDVRHIADRPFVVHAGNRTITVLGTRFAVRLDRGAVRVSVISGRVRVDAVAQPQSTSSSPVPPAILAPGNVAIGDGPSTLLVAQSVQQVGNGLAWRNGMLNFDQVTLGEAAAEFNRYNVRKIVITDPRLAAIRIGGAFRADNVDVFVRLLQDGYGLRVDRRADRMTISD